ncbi:hypothetical protein BKD30_02175 [Tersicoccus phoenicis]|uniref:Amidohydrolase 3 domain-containing protein n=1 Tax=Tersicoccus phoenicis TaxID=554083 RepID=A0A1R1LKW2_9MICC|nr:hypothetical protein [Tersicoccus phoenicis]OMH28163.1 hypothetical protein BKD30_02175 [Tersicoccus phoenicis]
MTRTLYRNGAVYSTHDPFATALLIDGQTVAWLGSEEAADGMAGGDVTVIDLAGALITPGLYDSALTVSPDRTDTGQSWAAVVAAGYVAVTVHGSAAHGSAAHAGAAEAAEPAAEHATGRGAQPDVSGVRAAGQLRALAAAAENPAAGLPEARLWARRTVQDAEGVGYLRDALGPHLAGVEPDEADRTDATALTAHLAAAAGAGLSAGWPVHSAAELDTLRHVLPAAAAAGAPLRTAGVHLAMSADLDAEDRLLLARHGVTVLVTPSSGSPLRTPLAALAADGVPLVLGSAGWTSGPAAPPWSLVRACVQHPDPAQRLSARAAFLALSRGGWRAARAAHPLLGQLVPGAPASYAVWEATELMVQTPDSTVAAWSTDPRARTPLLPALDQETDPRCLRTARDGLVLHDDGTLDEVTATR